MNDVVSRCIELAKQHKRRVVLPEGDDPRVREAAVILSTRQIADPILLGNAQDITTALQDAGTEPGSIAVLDSRTLQDDAALQTALIGKRPRIRANNIDQYLEQPVYQSVAMLHADNADAMVAGAVLATAKVMEASFAVGPQPGIKTLSSFFLMALPNPAQSIANTLFFADCALNIEPDAEQLAEIAIVSAASAEKLMGCQPKVAMLSFSTYGSAKHASVRKVARAVDIVRERAPHIDIDGEMQVDAALSPRVAKTKLAEPGPVAGQANVLIFPDLNAGNIAYKIVQYCGGAQATGPILQGFDKPVCDLSRGATVDDIVAAAAVTIALAS